MNSALVSRQLASDYLHLLVENPEQLEDIRLDNCATKYVLVNESHHKQIISIEELGQLMVEHDFSVFLYDVEHIQLSQTKNQIVAKFKLVSRELTNKISYTGTLCVCVKMGNMEVNTWYVDWELLTMRKDCAAELSALTKEHHFSVFRPPVMQ